MHILTVTPYFPPTWAYGGIPRIVDGLSRALVRLGHGVTVLTLGQYLRPSANHLPVIEYIHPDTFENYKEIARNKGFRHVASAPLVRSSYHAADFKPELDVI